MDKSKNLGEGNILKLILLMGIPTMFAQIVNLLYNIVDKIFIGHIAVIGGDALTGVGLCTALITIISAFAQFVGSGGAPLASIALGKNDLEKAKKILGNGVLFLIVMSIVLCIIFYPLENWYFKIVGGSDITSPYAKEYLNIYLGGTIFVMISLGLNNFITAQGKSNLAMFSIVIGAIINIALDPFFIYVLNMGVSGAALATVISQGCSCIWILVILFKKTTSLRIEFKYLKPDFKLMLDVASLGVAPFVMSSTESLITLTMSGQFQKYGGDDYVGSLAIMQSVMMIMSTPLTGFSQGVTSLMAYNYGAKKNDRLKKITKYSFLIFFLYGFVFSLMIIIFPRLFANMFTDDTSKIDITVKYMPLFMMGMTIFGLQRACQTTFVATHQAKISLFVALLRKVILLIPFAFIFPLFSGVVGVYLAEGVADLLSAVTCTIIFLIKFPKILRKNELEYEKL